MGGFESLPILYAMDAGGRLRYVDDVENGLACGCTCPDPRCGQELVARNRGRKRAHHFAHRRGTCEWAVEYVIASLAADIVSEVGRMSFPALTYRDACGEESVEISPARTLSVVSAGLECVSGRGAPELVVTCHAGGEEKRFAIVLALIHALKAGQLEKIAQAGLDVVLVDLRPALKTRRRELGRHYDRASVVAEFQDRARIGRLLADEDSVLKSWASNARRDAAEADSLARLEERLTAEAAEQQRQLAEAKRRAAWEAELAAVAEAELERMRPLVANPKVPAVDPSGRRWYRCDICGKVAAEDEFSDIRGWVRDVNLAVCKACA